MSKWEQEIINSRDLVLLNFKDLNWEKFDQLIDQVIDRYQINQNEISRPMINGIKKFHMDCKESLEKDKKVVLRYEVYSKMLRWIITRNNPRYLHIKFDEFRKAIKDLWVFLFGNCFHGFRYPTERKSYVYDKEEWLKWFNCIGGKIKEY